MKNWQYFAGCLALSAGIWLIHNLSHMQTDVVTVQVVAESNIAGRAAASSDAVSLTARCKASGFRLLYLERKKDAVRVRFDADDFEQEEGDYFSIGSAQLYRYVNDIFGAGTSVESFLFDKLRFRFIRELNKKLPVRVNSLMSFRPQYMQNGDFVKLTITAKGSNGTKTATLSSKDLPKLNGQDERARYFDYASEPVVGLKGQSIGYWLDDGGNGITVTTTWSDVIESADVAKEAGQKPNVKYAAYYSQKIEYGGVSQ